MKEGSGNEVTLCLSVGALFGELGERAPLLGNPAGDHTFPGTK
jgi:hypothetical protein